MARKLDAPIPRVALTPPEAAAALGVGPDFFNDEIRPELQLVRRNRKVLVAVAELERWVEQNAERSVVEEFEAVAPRPSPYCDPHNRRTDRMGDQREVSQEERLERVEQLVNRSGRVLLRLASQVAELGEQLERVEQMLDGPSPLVDAAELARQLGTSRSHIYKHSEELGAQRVGTGPKPRLRFNVDQARAAFLALNGAHPIAQDRSSRHRAS